MSGRHDLSRPLRDMVPLPLNILREPHEPLRLRQPRAFPHLPDPVLQTALPTAVAPSPFLNFEGVSNADAVLPPDTNGDIGPNHYVQWVNLTFAVYNRSGSLVYGPAAGRTIWSGFGGPCEARNDGDPIVLYDHLADRWIMSQFALPNNIFGLILVAPFYQCIAVSQTPDPTGPYYRYQYEFQKLNDYPKFGVWSDGYYMAINQYTSVTMQFAGQGVVAFDRAAMLAGQPARMVYFDLSSVDSNLGGMLPSDLDGPPPPPGTPNFFAEMDDDAAGYSPDQIQLWRFHVDWGSPSTSTFTGPYALPVAPFDSNMCNGVRDCIPQPGTSAKLDSISDRLMYRLQYRNFGTHDTLVVNHTVDVDGTDHAGIRWYEIRNPGGTPVIHQQGTYAPDALHRWMGSAAMDAAGNIAVAFNAASATTAPSIRYAARLASDPPGVFGLGENDLITGTGSQTHSTSRWGDYSMLAVDPIDGCTFWATTEYYAVTSAAGWQTRIGAFRLPGCGSTTPPAAPENLIASAASDTRINLTWTDQSSDETGFSVERCTGSLAACTASGTFAPIGQTAPGVTVYGDIALQGDTAYSYRVRAFNFGGSSAYSNIADATTPPAPPKPTVVISVADATATEAGPTNGVFTISRGTAQSSPLSLSLSVAGTAVGGSDYQTIPATVVIPSDQASVDILVIPVNDSAIESNETVVISVNASSAYTVGSPASGTVTIVSDDASVDLVVTSLTAPQGASAGEAVSLTDSTKNQGIDASGPSETSFYLSLNTFLEPSDTLLGTRSVPALPAGSSHSATTTFNLPPSLAPGTYYVIAKADGPGQISETQESNNTRLTSTRVGPDLLVTALTAPSSVGAGVPFNVTETTANLGGGNAGASSTRFYLSANFMLDANDTPLDARAVPALPAGASNQATTSLTVPAGTPTGSYYLIAQADSATAVLESTETNNTRSLSLPIGADLIVSALTAPLRVAAESTITVSDTTRNSAAGSAGGSTTAFYVSANLSLDASDIRLPSVRAIEPLAPNQTSTGSTTVTLPSIAAGTWYFLAKADDLGAVIETQENNNTRFATMFVGPDLLVSSFAAPTTATSGGAITVTDTVSNIGAAAAGGSTTRFYLSANTVLDASDVLLGGERIVAPLMAGTTNSGNTSLGLPVGTKGSYYLIAVADSTGVVAEATETNNTYARFITINP